MSQRSNALADRLEQGARALAGFASGLTEAEWETPLPKDGRKIGVVEDLKQATAHPSERWLLEIRRGNKTLRVEVG